MVTMVFYQPSWCCKMVSEQIVSDRTRMHDMFHNLPLAETIVTMIYIVYKVSIRPSTQCPKCKTT